MKFFPSSLLHVPIPQVRQDLYKSVGWTDIVDSKTNLAASALISYVSLYTIIHRIRKTVGSLFVSGNRLAFSLCPTDGRRRVFYRACGNVWPIIAVTAAHRRTGTRGPMCFESWRWAAPHIRGSKHIRISAFTLTEVFHTLTEVFLNLSEIFIILTEVFPCFFLICKANARVKLAKTGYGPHSSTLVVICVVLCIVCV